MEIQLDKKYPLDTKEQFTKAAGYFNKYLTRFNPKERVKIASALDTSSRKFDTNLDMDWITNYSRMNKSAAVSPDLNKSLDMRKEACKRNGTNVKILDNAVGADKMLNGISKLASNGAPAKTIVSALEEFDKLAGIEYLYDKEILDPIMSVHGSLNNPEFDSVKIAKEATQYDFLRASNDNVKLASIEKSMGKEFGNSFKINPITSLKKLGSVELELVADIILR